MAAARVLSVIHAAGHGEVGGGVLSHQIPVRLLQAVDGDGGQVILVAVDLRGPVIDPLFDLDAADGQLIFRSLFHRQIAGAETNT